MNGFNLASHTTALEQSVLGKPHLLSTNHGPYCKPFLWPSAQSVLRDEGVCSSTLVCESNADSEPSFMVVG